MGASLSVLLTYWAEKSRALALHNLLDGCAANSAGQTRSAVHRGFQLKVTRIALRIHKIFQAAATLRHRSGQHLLNGSMQFGNPQRTDFMGLDRWPNATHEQSFRSVNIAHAHHHIARQ